MIHSEEKNQCTNLGLTQMLKLGDKNIKTLVITASLMYKN